MLPDVFSRSYIWKDKTACSQLKPSFPDEYEVRCEWCIFRWAWRWKKYLIDEGKLTFIPVDLHFGRWLFQIWHPIIMPFKWGYINTSHILLDVRTDARSYSDVCYWIFPCIWIFPRRTIIETLGVDTSQGRFHDTSSTAETHWHRNVYNASKSQCEWFPRKSARILFCWISRFRFTWFPHCMMYFSLKHGFPVIRQVS